jgi:hypothetical protein
MKILARVFDWFGDVHMLAWCLAMYLWCKALSDRSGMSTDLLGTRDVLKTDEYRNQSLIFARSTGLYQFAQAFGFFKEESHE